MGTAVPPRLSALTKARTASRTAISGLPVWVYWGTRKPCWFTWPVLPESSPVIAGSLLRWTV